MRNVFQKELFILYSLQQRHSYIIHDSSSQFGLTKEDTTHGTFNPNPGGHKKGRRYAARSHI
jgi:hypothetical protein